MAPVDVINVIIVGGGPVGLALALDLGRRGVRSTVVERCSSTGTGLIAKASVINERSMEFCQLLGIRNDVASSGYPEELPADTVFCTALHGHFIGRFAMDSNRTRKLEPQSSQVMQRCPQCWFDPLLARAVVRQGMADIRYGIEVVGCVQDDAGVTCFLKHLGDGRAEQLRARYVVACDGPSSVVRKALGILFDGKDLGFAISAIVRVDLSRYHPFGAAERYMLMSHDGTWANFTAIDGRSLWRFSVAGGEKKVDPASIDMPALLERAFGRDDVEYELMRVVQWRRSQYTAEKYCKGRIFLAGDCAHTMPPTGGHGLNTGLGDVMTLSWILQALLQGWGGQGLIEAYDHERRPVAIRNGSEATKNYTIWIERQGREKVLDEGLEADEYRRMLGEEMAANMRPEFRPVGLALGYNYSASPVVVPDGSPAPPDEPDVYIQTARPGHRAPHCWLKDGSSTIDLFGRGFVLLSFGAEAIYEHRLVDAARKVHLPLDCVTIAEIEAADLYQRRLVLVRPDGMIAWRGDSLPDDVEGLLDRVRGASIAANCETE
ncbi:hypothetical protein OIDMADRAFT_60477 [Oidiodendron maius Zn]|uniref:FAD-binding domain-containing protein n=1 Tax=Oidiodendron maius (strain Zn) TaxID=913774 RepID=A0A0C3GF02_OIDMZ|nr:hypothetical protein OIDMADRAFT_60477 [Oidiodendron maius Zn]